MTEKENLEWIAINSIAIPVPFNLFCDALKHGGKIEFSNKLQKYKNDIYFHALRYKGDLYITTTSYFVKDFVQ